MKIKQDLCSRFVFILCFSMNIAFRWGELMLISSAKLVVDPPKLSESS